MRVKACAVQTLQRKKLIAFGWFGGKFSHLDWLLPLLPKCYHYVEPFGGSAAVLLNKKPSPSETYNDLDGELCLFFKVLREQPKKLIRALENTPFSREEFALACSRDYTVPALERARRFFILARQSRSGLAQTATVGQWANCKKRQSSVVRWQNATHSLQKICERLMRVQIENRNAEEIIQLYDSKKTLFYCDPPYVHSTRTNSTTAYKYEMDDEQQTSFAKAANGAVGMVAVSNYDCALMDKLYPKNHWRKIVGPAKLCETVKTKRHECLWVNYPISALDEGLFQNQT